MRIFDTYLLRNLTIATVFIAVVLALIVFLTQSLRFLEILINAGSTGNAFWIITALALPKFFEVILPLAVMAATLFLYNKMTIDSELIAMRAVGHSHLSLAKPALVLGGVACFILLWISMWIAPNSANKMHKMRMELSAEFSNILFREGIFNPVGKGLTVYIRDRTPTGELSGIMIHDTRNAEKMPSTVLAKRGMMVSGDTGQQVIVFDGARHEYNQQSGVLQRLAFDRYTIDLPESSAIPQRWQQPDERNIFELLSPDLSNQRDVESLREFSVEIHRRLAGALMAIVFPLIALNALLLGGVDRRGQISKVILAIVLIILLQGLFIAASNIARNSNGGIFLMYALTVLPCLGGYALLAGGGEKLRNWLLDQKAITA
jgi:lipopolysaccharide export system permease protein